MTNLIEENKQNSLDEIYETFLNEFNNDELLKRHRQHVEKFNLGFGERPFHTLWREIVKSQKENFRFLEIGVYKGQVLSLVKLLSNHLNKKIEYYGVTPLTNLGDKYSNYEFSDYSKDIQNIFSNFSLEFDLNVNIINGDSTQELIKSKIQELKYFDVVYIDGCHNYNCVVSDLNLAKSIIQNNGLIVLDDSSCYKNLTPMNGRFKGHIEVCDAIKDNLENDENYLEIICVGHNRVFQKIK